MVIHRENEMLILSSEINLITTKTDPIKKSKIAILLKEY